MQKQYEPSTVARRPAGALSRKDAASYLSVSTRQIDNYSSAGLIPRIKLGAKTVFRVSDLDAFLESRVRPSSETEADKGNPRESTSGRKITASELIDRLRECDPESIVLINKVQECDKFYSIPVVNTVTPGVVVLDFEYFGRDADLDAFLESRLQSSEAAE